MLPRTCIPNEIELKYIVACLGAPELTPFHKTGKYTKLQGLPLCKLLARGSISLDAVVNAIFSYAAQISHAGLRRLHAFARNDVEVMTVEAFTLGMAGFPQNVCNEDIMSENCSLPT